MTDWVPMDAVGDYHERLYEGVEAWMQDPLAKWLKRVLEATYNGVLRHQTDWVQQFDSRSRRPNPLTPPFTAGGVSYVVAWLNQEGGYINFLDFLISKLSAPEDKHKLTQLEGTLAMSGSAWKVGQRGSIGGLERRVPIGVQEAADAAMAIPGDAGRLLSEAWHAAFGLNPQADLAYRKALEAVEAAVLPKVIPNDSARHLGKAIQQMRADDNWTLPFIKEHSQNPTGAVVISMLQALWSGHSDRHPGTADYVQSTPEAAEAAVYLAVSLVAWFHSESVARR